MFAPSSRCAAHFTSKRAVSRVDHSLIPNVAQPRNLRRRQTSGKFDDARTSSSQDRTGYPSLARSNLELERLAARGRGDFALVNCIRMKRASISPNITTYHCLMEALSKTANWREAWALIEDAKASGVKPDTLLFNHILVAVAHARPDESWKVYQSILEHSLDPNTTTYEHLLRRYLTCKNFEMTLKVLFDMEQRNISPRIDMAQEIVCAAIDSGLSRLALELAVNFESGGLRRLKSNVWVSLLTASTDTYFKDGVLTAWNKVVNVLNITPDEGTCVEALHVAGRFGLADFALEVLHILKRIEVPLAEHHFAPMIQAFIRSDRLKDALGVLCMIRAHKLVSSAETALPIFQALQAQPALMDAAWSALEELQNEGNKLDISCINVIIQAAVAQGDLQRAFGAYQMLPELSLSPTTDTFNTLLAGASAAKHRELGNSLLRDMKAAGLHPDIKTYEHLVLLCLSGEDYEDAFFYLEEMKSHQFMPPPHLYEAIIRRCLAAEDPRYTIAINEMDEIGYDVPQDLKKHVRRNPRSDKRFREKSNKPFEPESAARTTAESASSLAI